LIGLPTSTATSNSKAISREKPSFATARATTSTANPSQMKGNSSNSTTNNSSETGK
jgi:hypothetical protein